MKLSILIPTLDQRAGLLHGLLAELDRQIMDSGHHENIQVLVYPDGGELTVGDKRNKLLEMAQGDYLCFFDDDDWPGEQYIDTLVKGMAGGYDCVALRGIMTTNGHNEEIFEHSIRYGEYKTTQNEIKYERYPNHLNCIRADIAKAFSFPCKDFGEDTEWATKVYQSGLLKTEYHHREVIYFYNYKTDK